MKKNIIIKTFFIVIIMISLLIGIIFSSLQISENAQLDSTFVGKYVATVKVDKNKGEDTSNENYAKESAEILENRLNPMGINDISIEIAGNNYLKVHGSKSTFKDKELFKSEIQKTGSIFLLSPDETGTLNDVSIINSSREETEFDKKTLDEFVESAKAGTHSVGGTKNPIIDFKINSTNFENLFPKSEDAGQAPQPLNLKMFSDPDAFFESVRSMYKTIDIKNSNQRISKYFDRVIKPIKKIVDSNKDSAGALAIEDMFAGTVKESNGTRKTYNLIKSDGTGDVDLQFFKENYSSWEWKNNTTKYVYNSNASKEEFTDTDGTYKNKIINEDNGKDIGFIEDVFKELINMLLGNWYEKQKNLLDDEFTAKVNNQFIFDGSIYQGEQSNSMPKGTGFISGTSMKLFVDSFAKSRIGATIFQASGKGYIFNVDSINFVEALINNTFFIIMTIALLILLVLFMLYMVFAYKILGVFVLATVLAIMFATLAIASAWLGLTFGIETILAMFIIFVINCQLSIMLIDSMKKSVYKLKRDLKSSLNLSIKENAGVIVDILVAILIPSFCLFWVSTAAMKTFSILITFGIFFSLIGQLILLLILFKLIVGTQLFSKVPFLFATNIDGESHLEMIYLYRIDLTKAALEKAIVKGDQLKIENLKNKLEKQNSKLEQYHVKQNNKLSENETKYIVHLNKQKTAFESKLAKQKNERKKLILELKIIDIDKTLEQMGVVNETNSNVVVETFDRYELSKFKSRSGFIAKILVVGFMVLSVLSVGLGFGIGINYDSTMGGRVEYTIYGANVDTNGQAAIEEISKNPSADPKLAEFSKEIISNWYNVDGETNSAELYAEFISTAFTKYQKEIMEVAKVPVSLTGVKFETVFGYEFQFSSASSKKTPWVQIQAKNISSKQSNKFKRALFDLKLVDEYSENSEIYGMISKRIFSKTSTNTIVATAIAFGISLLVLGIYILIRYSWTYFVALAMGSVLLIALIIVIVIGVHLVVGPTMVMSLWTLFILFIMFTLIYFGKIKEKISSKDNKSMNEFFNTEIDVLIDMRSFKKNLKKDILELKAQRRVELKERKLKFKTTKSKEKKLNLNKEEVKANIILWKSELKVSNNETKSNFKQQITELKNVRRAEQKILKKSGNEKIIVASKENNYVLSIVLSVFKENLNKFIFILGCYAITFIIFMIFIPTIFSMGMTLLIGSILGWVIISFICLPMWLTIEQRRLRKNLTRKKFISELKVTNEEQIVEGIND